MQPKKKSRYFWWILTIFFVVYIGYFIAMENGYYETKVNEEVLLTEEEILKFEKDVKEGKEIDIDNYKTSNKVVNNEGLSKIGLTFSTKSEEIMNDGFKELVKILKTLFGGK